MSLNHIIRGSNAPDIDGRFRSLLLGEGLNSYELPLITGPAGSVIKMQAGDVSAWEDPDLSSTGVVYRPGAVSSGSVFGSWADAALAASLRGGPLTIYIDDSIITPAPIDADFDGAGLVTLSPYVESVGNSVRVLVSPDVQLNRIRALIGIMVVTTQAQTIPTFVNSDGGALFVQMGSSIEVGAASLVPAIQVADGEGLLLSVSYGSYLTNAAAPAVPFANLGVGSSLVFATFETSNALAWTNDLISGDATATLIWAYDATRPAITFAAFLGAVNTQPVERANFVAYDDAGLPALGDNVGDALDYIKANTPWGVTANYAIQFGGILLNALDRPFVGGDYASVASGVASPANEAIVPINSSVMRIAYNTAGGSVTTQVTALANGVGIASFLLAGTSGVVAQSPIAINAGDRVAFQFDGLGTVPGATNVSFYFA